MVIGVGSVFLGNSIFILPKNYNLIDAEFLPLSIKLMPLFFSLGGAILSLLLNHYHKNFLIALKLDHSNRAWFRFFNQKWYFDKIYNFFIIKKLFLGAYSITFKLIDKGFIEVLGPAGLSNRFNLFARHITWLQSGLIFQYTFILLLGVLFYVNVYFFTIFLNNISGLILLFFNVLVIVILFLFKKSYI